MRFLLLLLYLHLSVFVLIGQSGLDSSFALRVIPLMEGQALALDTAVYTHKGEPLQIETLRFYLSNIALLKGDQFVWQESESYHLIDAVDPTSFQLALGVPVGLAYDSIQFLLGIDSTTSVSGAMGGDLDPTKGMYWSWNSGYVNFKLEGTSPLCDSRNHEFQYHLGGYLPPFQSAQQIRLAVNEKEAMAIKIDIGKILKEVDLSQQTHIMSPGAEAQQLAEQIATLFYCDE